MKLVKESLSRVVECDKQQLVESCTPSLEVIEARIADMNPHLDCEVQAQIALKLREMVRCAIQCAAEEFGVANIDAARWLDWVVEDLKVNGCPDDCVAQIFIVPEETAKPEVSVEEVDSSTSLADPERSCTGELENSVLADPVDYWIVVYRHPTGIYATAVAEGSREAVKALFENLNLGCLISCEEISEEEFRALVAGGLLDLAAVGSEYKDADPVEPVCFNDRDKLTEAVIQGDRLEDLIKNVTVDEGVQVAVDTDKQKVDVKAAEYSDVDISIKPQDSVESSVEDELAALAEDPKYAKAYNYLLHLVDSEEVVEDNTREPLEEDLEHLLAKTVEQEENVVEVPAEEPVLEVESPKGPEDSFVAEQLGILIKDEYDAIEGYNRFLQDLEANSLGDDSDKKVICDILAEENVHIGQLQELLKKVAPTAENIEVGAEEARAQIEAAEEDNINED